MDAYTRSESPGMVGASAFFSWKARMWPSLEASMTPNSAACFFGTGMAATVTSALRCTWKSIMLMMFMR